MSEVWNLSTTDDSNTGSAFGFPEGMNASDVNDRMRALSGALARQLFDLDGTLVSGGSGSAYTVASNRSLTTSYGDNLVIAMRMHAACATGATLNVGGKGAKQILKWGATTTLSASDILANQICVFSYETTLEKWQMMTPVSAVNRSTAVGDLLASNNLSDVAAAATARTNLGLGTAAVKNTGTANGNVVLLDATGLPAVDGSQLTGLSGGATDAEKANIMLNAFRISVNGGLSVQNMVDGVVDEFEDETGVDTSTSTNEAYDSTSDFYSGTGLAPTSSTSGAWSGDTGDFTFSGDDIAVATGDQAIKLNTSFSGDFEVNFTLTVAPNVIWGLWPISDDGNYSSGGGGVTTDHSVSWGFGKSVNELTQGTSQSGIQSWTPANGSAIKITRVGSTFKVYDDDVLIHTWASTSSAEVRFGLSAHNTNPDLDDFSWSTPVSLNMTLVSNAATALAAPDDANVVLWQEDVDSVTLNTDLKAYASRNGGTTFTQITLAKEASLQGVAVETLIARALGTVIGNMTDGGGIAAAFDGTDHNAMGASARSASNDTTGLIGKDWGGGNTKAVTKCICHATSDEGFSENRGNSVDLNLKGSTDNFSSSNVALGTVHIASPGSAAGTEVEITITATSAYRYHRVEVVKNGGTSGTTCIGEVEFYEDVPGTSTNILTGTVDISGQSSGTSMKYKIETLNTKEQKIHAVALQWS